MSASSMISGQTKRSALPVDLFLRRGTVVRRLEPLRFSLRELCADTTMHCFQEGKGLHMHARLRLFAALCVVPLWFLTTDSLLGESPQQEDRSGPLTSLKSLHIVVDEVNADARKAGITESDLEAQTLAGLKRNIPTLTIREGGPFIGITVTILENKTVVGQSLGYAAFVYVDVTRPVVILSDDGNSIPVSQAAKVWDKGTLVTGTRNDIAGQVKDVLDLFLIQFSVDYYKQN